MKVYVVERDELPYLADRVPFKIFGTEQEADTHTDRYDVAWVEGDLDIANIEKVIAYIDKHYNYDCFEQGIRLGLLLALRLLSPKYEDGGYCDTFLNELKRAGIKAEQRGQK
jgi:hypothetical protein